MINAKKILITGNTGRIGQALSERLVKVTEVWGLSRYSRQGSLEEAQALGVKPIRADIGQDSLSNLPGDFDHVLHLAEARAPRTAAEGLATNCEGVARVMKHCRNSRAFLYLSSAFVYKAAADPSHNYGETADIGSNHGGQYAPTKITGEAAARAGSIVFGIPTVICRANVAYGGAREHGLIDRAIDCFVATGEVPAPAAGPIYLSPIHVDDIFDLLAPSLSLAATPARVLKWSGDEKVEWCELFHYVGELIGKRPQFVVDPDFDAASRAQDPALRRSIAGPVATHWREGVRRVLETRHPNLVLQDA